MADNHAYSPGEPGTRKALVTGATGFIGSHLCEELVRRGYSVFVLSRNAAPSEWIRQLNLSHLRGDCTIRESLSHIDSDFDYVFHLAGLTKSCCPDDFFCINAQGTENLVDIVVRLNPSLKRFVYVSSLAAVGPSTNGEPVSEDTPPKPVSAYGRSKLAGEHAILKYSDRIPITIVRPPAVYGPRDRDMLVVFRMIKKGFFFDLGKCYYSLLYVDDLVQGILLSAEKNEAINRTYFLSDGNIYTGEEIAQEIAYALGVRAKRVSIPEFAMPVLAAISERINKRGIINRDRVRDFRHKRWICSPERAHRELGFKAMVAIKEGIRWTADWYRMQGWL